MSDEAIRTAYAAKIAAKKCILIRIALAKANIDALEKRNDFFQTLQREAEEELAAHEADIECIRMNMGGRGIVEDDIEFYHAVYAEELVALSTADLQLAHMVVEPRRKKHGTSEDSDDLGDTENSDASSMDSADM